jgi:hypothetical protein
MVCRKICHRVPRGCHPKRRKAHRKGKRKGFSKRGYKKCIMSAMKRTKFKTPTQARKAYSRAAKKCRKLLAGKVRRKGGKRRKKHGRRRGPRISWQERRAVGVMPGSAGAFAAAMRRMR